MPKYKKKSPKEFVVVKLHYHWRQELVKIARRNNRTVPQQVVAWIEQDKSDQKAMVG